MAPSSPFEGPIRWLLLAAVFALGALAQAYGLPNAIINLKGDLIYATRQHLWLVGVSAGSAIAVGIPLGILATRPIAREWESAIVQVLNIGSSIPTLAKMAIAMSFVGIGNPPAIIGLFVVTLLPVTMNTIAGLRSVPSTLLEAARAMGMSPRQILTEVELPNALFVILAGIRTGLALCIGTAPLAFLLGAPSLGELIFTGIALYDTKLLFIGAAATALLAILVDVLLGQLQFWIVRRGVNPLR